MPMLSLMALLLSVAGSPSPLEEVGEGKLLCYSPDHDQKTCLALEAYVPTSPNRFKSTSRVRVYAIDHPVTHTSTVEARLSHESICVTPSARDVARARIRISPTMPVALRDLVRIVMRQASAEVVGQEHCMLFEVIDEGLIARTFVNGKRDEGLDLFVKWVSPAEGYHLGP